MTGVLTVVMYHYVRDVVNTRFSNLKALSVSGFEGQLDYFQKHYQIISPDHLLECVQVGKLLPSNAIFLTFDDGYMEHFDVVRPILCSRGISAAFFPIGSVIAERKLPQFSKVHLILARGAKIHVLNGLLEDLYERYGTWADLPCWKTLRGKYAHANHLDDAETIFFKRMLQVGLPEPVRGLIVDKMYHEIVGEKEEATVEWLYMGLNELDQMVSDGMHIGCHGYLHEWMDTLQVEEQEKDVDRALNVLSHVKGNSLCRMFCYPYGGYNSSLVDVLRRRGIQVGFTVDVRLANTKKDDFLLMPRLDTIHLPVRGDAPVHEWTRALA